MIPRDLWHGVKLLLCTPYLGFDGFQQEGSWSPRIELYSVKYWIHSQPFFPLNDSHSCAVFCFFKLFWWSCSGKESHTRFPADFRVTILLLQLYWNITSCCCCWGNTHVVGSINSFDIFRCFLKSHETIYVPCNFWEKIVKQIWYD